MANVNEALTREDIKLIRSALLLKKLALVQEWIHDGPVTTDMIARINRLISIMDEILKED